MDEDFARLFDPEVAKEINARVTKMLEELMANPPPEVFYRPNIMVVPRSSFSIRESEPVPSLMDLLSEHFLDTPRSILDTTVT